MVEHHFVVDLETASTRAAAAIYSYGVVYVQLSAATGELLQTAELYVRTKPSASGHLDPETLAWWSRQSPEALAEVNGDSARIGLPLGLDMLQHFMESHAPDKGTRRVWGNGSSFDNAILEEAFSAELMDLPWEYWNDRDLRTLLELFPAAKAGIEFQGTKHHALFDARHEARLLVRALQQAKQQAQLSQSQEGPWLAE
jgi:hypothetical protein